MSRSRRRTAAASIGSADRAIPADPIATPAFGGYGYVDEYPVQKLLLGRAETGVSAFL